MYLLYGHENLGEWVKALEIKDQAENEISVLKGEYLKEFKIKGLVLDSIVENVSTLLVPRQRYLIFYNLYFMGKTNTCHHNITTIFIT